MAEAEIPHAIFYTFSTENWRRGEEEVTRLLGLLLEDIRDKVPAKVRVVGRREDFPLAVQENLRLHEADGAKKDSPTTIWVALSYGGRAEIVAAVNQAITKGEVVTEEQFAKLLWTAGLPDPDLIIRTGGEQRLSNFLPWQSIYSELFFTPTYWPAFTKDEFTGILSAYGTRDRRIGS